MNRIDEKFNELRRENKKALITFVTAGDPDFEVSEKIIIEMEKKGADIIELGVPFSDPSSGGSEILESNIRAMKKGADIYSIFDFVKKIRNNVSVPMVFMIYYNVIFQYGVEKFFKKCASVGIDGVIIPDLSFEESGEIAEYTQKYNVYNISMLSSASNEKRVEKIAKSAKGFLYCISADAVNDGKLNSSSAELFENIRKYTDIPYCVDCDTSSRRKLGVLIEHCDGAIIGSGIVKALAGGKKNEDKIKLVKEKMYNLKEVI